MNFSTSVNFRDGDRHVTTFGTLQVLYLPQCLVTDSLNEQKAHLQCRLSIDTIGLG